MLKGVEETCALVDRWADAGGKTLKVGSDQGGSGAVIAAALAEQAAAHEQVLRRLRNDTIVFKSFSAGDIALFLKVGQKNVYMPFHDKSPGGRAHYLTEQSIEVFKNKVPAGAAAAGGGKGGDSAMSLFPKYILGRIVLVQKVDAEPGNRYGVPAGHRIFLVDVERV